MPWEMAMTWERGIECKNGDTGKAGGVAVVLGGYLTIFLQVSTRSFCF
jgi:hypothetical protein